MGSCGGTEGTARRTSQVKPGTLKKSPVEPASLAFRYGELTPNGKLETLIPDDRIAGPNEGSIGPDSYYYVPNSRAPLVNRPYEVFKIPLA